ncbi:glycoside hydrolase family 42 [Paraglaciecola aquimarina]|uniref:Glycoside hydrolase family 42 n=1 Tax=Paraglaciecola aquimarina TaxID=1235557 RepID=A0ABU3STM6_9ALTE|nr:glycoside hydrolase family 42 [Paraglaciecola aquimarina]MDU0353360.1 glycoside hydrolase family 42 [Paraglaciecola aquimarina]
MKPYFIGASIASALVFMSACNNSTSSTETSVQSTKVTQPATKATSELEQTARLKLKTLERIMAQARAKDIDVTREETVVWFANEFLKFANWDENNQDAITYLMGEYYGFKDKKEELAAMVPDFQREKVLSILDGGIAELSAVLSGDIQRRPVNKVDWKNIEVSDDMLLSNGKPIFLYDYFSKSVGRPLTDTQVYNDHLGAIFHGGENLYPVDHDRAINSFLLNEDRTFNQELLKEVTDISDTNVGFLIYWNMGIPEWVEKLEPEVRLGRSLFTGYDIDNPLVRDVWGTIAKETGALTRGKKVSQLGYILANEPHWYTISSGWTRRTGEMQNISSYTVNKARQWLRNKYHGNIEQLNKNWNSQYSSFDTIEIPMPIPAKLEGTPKFYDLARYNMDRAIDWFTFVQNELHKGNPDADTHIKIMPHLFTDDQRHQGIDLEALTDLTTMIGDDAKARETRSRTAKNPEAWEAHYAYFWEELSLAYDFMESVSPNKIHVNSESHFLSAGNWREFDTSVEYVESVYWLATVQGMDVNLAWFWARDPDGSPEDRLEGELNFFDNALAGSFAGSVNQQPHIANAYTQVMYDLNSFSEEIMALRAQRRPIRLFHSETSAINKTNHMSQQFKLYEKIYFDGFPVGFVTENIIKKQDNKSWDTVVVYKTEYVTQAELNTLQTYLDQGGTVIIDSNESLSKNEYGQPHTKTLSASKGNLINLAGKADIAEIRQVSLKSASNGLPDLVLDENNGTEYKGVNWRAVKQENGSYLVNLNNLGKHKAKLTLSLKGGEKLNITNMMTGKSMKDHFQLAPKGVLLLHVTVE